MAKIAKIDLFWVGPLFKLTPKYYWGYWMLFFDPFFSKKMKKRAFFFKKCQIFKKVTNFFFSKIAHCKVLGTRNWFCHFLWFFFFLIFKNWKKIFCNFLFFTKIYVFYRLKKSMSSYQLIFNIFYLKYHFFQFGPKWPLFDGKCEKKLKNGRKKSCVFETPPKWSILSRNPGGQKSKNHFFGFFIWFWPKNQK